MMSRRWTYPIRRTWRRYAPAGTRRGVHAVRTLGARERPEGVRPPRDRKGELRGRHRRPPGRALGEADLAQGTFWWRGVLRLSATGGLLLTLVLVLGWCAALAPSEGRVWPGSRPPSPAT
jgi:hypothetical protein